MPLSFSLKAQYGIGEISNGMVGAGFGFFLLFYLTAVCGMSGTVAGSATLIATLVDAVADPAIGLASDRLKTRWGRRLPFMVVSIIPFAIAFGVLFSMPASLTGSAQFLYVTVCLIVLRLALSAFILPFTAVGAEITDDYRERASVVAFRLTFQNAGVLACVVLGLGVFMAGLVMGASSNLYAMLASRPGALVREPGIILLVPGSGGFRSLSAVLERDVLLGLDTAVSLIVVLISLVAGLLFGDLLIPPRRAL